VACARKVYGCALPGPGTATVLFPVAAADIPACTDKVHAKIPKQQSAIRGVRRANRQAARRHGLDSSHRGTISFMFRKGAPQVHSLARNGVLLPRWKSTVLIWVSRDTRSGK
jgi:hypothetical protein